MKEVRRTILALAAALSAAGCMAPHQAVVTDVDPVLWDRPAGLVIRNTDTLTLREVEFFVRHNDRFAGDTLTVEVTTLSPDTLRHTERFLLRLSRTATAAALTQQSVVPYRSKVRFAHSGNYRMTITPVRPVSGIEAVGINIVKSN